MSKPLKYHLSRLQTMRLLLSVLLFAAATETVPSDLLGRRLLGRSLPTRPSPKAKIYTQLDHILQMVGPLSSSQKNWLAYHTRTRQALTAIAQTTRWTDQQKAAAIFDHFSQQADPILSAIQMAREVAYLKAAKPSWPLARVVFIAALNVTKGEVHTVLDLAGLVPVLGEGADFANGVLYILEGDQSNAAYSFAATVPGVGWMATGAKYAGLIVVTAKGFKADLKFIKNSKGLLTFGRRSQLATVIGKKANHQVHHIIPWAKNEHTVVQQAAKSGNWHPNLAKNGIQLDLSTHSGYGTAHSIYNTRVEAALNEIISRNGPNISPKGAANELSALAHKIRNQLNQGKKLDEITF